MKSRLSVIQGDIERNKQLKKYGVVMLPETEKPSEKTVAEFLEEWWTGYLPKNVKPMTVSQYGTQIHVHIVPALGGIKLHDLDKKTIQEFLNGVKGRGGKVLSPKSIQNLHHVLHGALEYAIDLGYISKNPADRVKLPKLMKKHNIRPLERDEVPRFMEAVKEDPYARIYRVLLGTGMREGEILGLRWKDVDLERGRITVRGQLQKERKPGGKYEIVVPKNSKSRTFNVAGRVISELKAQQKEQKEARLKAGSVWTENHNPSWDLVFTEWNGRYISANTMRNHFIRCATSIGRPDLRVHDLRHTFAVLSLEQGVDAKTLSHNLGHASVAFTLNVYGHVWESMGRGAAEKVDNALAVLWG